MIIINFLRTAALYSVYIRNTAVGLRGCMDDITSFSFFTHLLSQILFLLSILGTRGRGPGEKGMKQER